MTIADLVNMTQFYDLDKVCGKKHSIGYDTILSKDITCYSGDLNTG